MSDDKVTSRVSGPVTELVRFCEEVNAATFHSDVSAPGGRYHVVVTRNLHFVQLLELLTVRVPDADLSRMLFEDHGIGAPPEGGAGA